MQENYESLAFLHKLIKKGDTIYTVLRHVSRSGMQRRIDVYVIKNNKPLYLTYHVAQVLGSKIAYRINGKDKSGITINDCGMDMGYSIVSNLSIAMFCPNKYDHDSAYALKHKWL